MKRFFTLAFALLLISSSGFAQSGYKVGAKVADFTLNNVQNQAVSLSNFNNSKAVVVVFTSINCPYAKLYEGRLQNLAKSYAARGVQFVFVNPAIGLDEGGETVAQMADKVNTSQFALPYLIDEGQKVSKQFGAMKVPEVFVLKNVGDGFSLRYKGAIDDNPQVEEYVKENYLKSALDNVLSDRAVPVADRRATGCMIKQF